MLGEIAYKDLAMHEESIKENDSPKFKDIALWSVTLLQSIVIAFMFYIINGFDKRIDDEVTMRRNLEYRYTADAKNYVNVELYSRSMEDINDKFKIMNEKLDKIIFRIR